jgi:hypothetical protein
VTDFTEFIDITGSNADRAPLVKGGLRAYYATGTDGIEETARQIAAAKAAGMGVLLIDQTPSLSVFASGLAQVADIENYAGTITAAVGAVKTREAHGLDSDLYVSYNGLVAVATALLSAVVIAERVRFWIADYNWSLAEAQQFLAQNPNWGAVQYGDPHSNPRTLVPGTSVMLAQCNADIDVAKAEWAARFMPGLPVPPPAPAAWPVTEEGNSGKRVRVLQYLLRAHGEALVTDSVFGPLTKHAVKAWQRARHLTVDGIAGPQTWPTLTPATAQGAHGDVVRAVQIAVGAADDGIFGLKTKAALEAFQKSHRLTADGIAGPLTWPALVNAG